MSSKMKSHKWRKWLGRIFVFTFLGAVAVAIWAWRLDIEMKKRIAHGWFRPPVNLYARGEVLFTHEIISASTVRKSLLQRHYRERFGSESLYPKDFIMLNHDQCAKILNDDFMSGLDACVEFREGDDTIKPSEAGTPVLIAFSHGEAPSAPIQGQQGDGSWTISHIFGGEPFTEVKSVQLEPELFAQFYNGKPILRQIIDMGDVPLDCSEAVTAIEDRTFLENPGISFKGILRALVNDVLKGRYAEGGSTITQQLVKNYFLTPQKTLRRKITEVVMAMLLDASLRKDQILENYLNVIYMGQSGPFQVIGFGAASRHYFNEKLNSIDLPKCALLAAIINNPGYFDPFTHPNHARERRSLVLKAMVSDKMISQQDADWANSTPLPTQSEESLHDPAPYYTQAIFRELKRLNISTENGLNVYTSLDVGAQESAEKKVLEHVRKLEQDDPYITKLKAKGEKLEASLISVDVDSGDVLALVGGRHFENTQYNRVLDAHRQVGSVMKIFDYLAALEGNQPNGKPYTATSLIKDEPFVYHYQGQEWSPRDYTRTYHGEVPLFYALKDSLNDATARMGIQVGLTNIVDVARRAGITQSNIEPLPSLTLGAFELYPWEVATGALTVARFGLMRPLQYVLRVTDPDGQEIYVAHPKDVRAFSPQTVAVLIGMMKQTLLTGTARRATLEGFDWPAAGKTGTTSDTRDAWFVGFTPHVLTVTWTGYDDNTPSMLTGASGALPLWLSFMRDYCKRFPKDDFAWPKGVEKFTYTAAQLRKQVPTAYPFETAQNTTLIRIK